MRPVRVWLHVDRDTGRMMAEPFSGHVRAYQTKEVATLMLLDHQTVVVEYVPKPKRQAKRGAK